MPRRPSTWARVLAGGGALVAVISLLILIIAANSGTEPNQAVGSSPGASMSSEVTTPALAGSDKAIVLASFEEGTEGWLPDHKDNGTVSQASDFHTQGSFSLRIDNRGLPERGWYGKNFPSPIDISGKRAVSVDISTREVGTQTAIAVQFGDADWTWCQSPEPWGAVDAGTDRRTVTLSLDLGIMNCPEGRPTSGLSKLNAVWVWFEGKGSFRLDNVRIE